MPFKKQKKWNNLIYLEKVASYFSQIIFIEFSFFLVVRGAGLSVLSVPSCNQIWCDQSEYIHDFFIFLQIEKRRKEEEEGERAIIGFKKNTVLIFDPFYYLVFFFFYSLSSRFFNKWCFDVETYSILDLSEWMPIWLLFLYPIIPRC